jgi:hypothetical protein
VSIVRGHPVLSNRCGFISTSNPFLAAYYAFGDPGTLAGLSRTSQTPQKSYTGCSVFIPKKIAELLLFESRTQGANYDETSCRLL